MRTYFLAVYHFTERTKTHKLQPCVSGKTTPYTCPQQQCQNWSLHPPQMAGLYSTRPEEEAGLHTHHVKQRQCPQPILVTAPGPSIRNSSSSELRGQQVSDRHSRSRTEQTVCSLHSDRRRVQSTVKIYNRTRLCAITCHNNIYDNPD